MLFDLTTQSFLAINSNDEMPFAGNHPQKARPGKNISIGTRVRCLWGRNENRTGNVIQVSGNSIRVNFDCGVGVKCVLRNSLMLINDRVCCTKSKINTALWINNTNQSQVLLSHKDGLQSILRVPSRGSPDYKVRPSSCRARRVSFSGDTAVLNDCVTSTTTTDSSCRSTDHSSKKKRQVSFLSREEKEKENVKNTQNVKTKAKERESGGGIAVNRAPSRNISGSEQRRPARMVKKVLATSNTPERPTPRYRLRSIGCRNEAVQEERSDFVGSRVLCSQGTYKGYGGKVQVDHGQTVTVEFDGVMGPRRIIKTCLKSPVGERKWQSSAAW